MPRRVLIPIVALIVLSTVGMTVAAFAMATMMDDWHWRMMGGRGSDPSEETPQSGVTQVRLEDFAFSPANIVIDAGTTVTWTNYDGVAHTVTSDGGEELDSPLFGDGETFSHTFREPGEYPYYCQPHPNMRGLVTVRAAE